MTEREVDLVVIGGGPAGENLAQYAMEGSDLSVLLVEAELIGGECSYYACMPSKALLRPIEVATTAAQLPGVSTPSIVVDELLRRRDDWVSHYDDHGQADWAESAGIDVLRGHARLVGERLVEVTSADRITRVRARVAVGLATGSVPVIPEPLAAANPWDSRDVTAVLDIPDRLAVVGGGVVACEAATWMAALGSKVTMLVRGDRLLAGQEPRAGELVTDGLRERGVDVRFETSITDCTREVLRDNGLGRLHGGAVRLDTTDGELIVDELLVAAGRRPRLADVGLDSVGLTADDVLRHRLPTWLLAVGDASGEPALTHWGKYRGRVLGAQLAAEATGAEAPIVPDRVPVPQVVFTDPQVASVGLTEAAAREVDPDVVAVTVDFGSAAGAALLRDDARGFATLVVDPANSHVLGATFVGPEVADLIHPATVAIIGKTPVHLLRHAVPSYPTVSELWLRLLEALPTDLRRARN